MVLKKLRGFSDLREISDLIIFLGTKILKWLVIKTKIRPIIEPMIEGNSNPKREIINEGTTKATPDQRAKGKASKKSCFLFDFLKTKK